MFGLNNGGFDDMKRAVKWMCAVALVFVAQNVFADNRLTSKDYVQSGLIMQFDGIANNGWSAEEGDIHASAPTTPKELAVNASMSKSGTFQYGDNYILFPGSAYMTSGNLASIRNALTAKTMTVELFMRPLSYTKYKGYLHIGETVSYRELVLDQREDLAIGKGGAFGGVQYAATGWTGASACCINQNTSSYINKDVLVTLIVDSTGAHLYLDNGACLHTNPGGGATPNNGKVRLGAYGTTAGNFRLYSARIYNRVLSAEERAINRDVDRNRFLGVSIETDLSIAATDADTEVSLDGETWSANIARSGVACPTSFTVKARNTAVAEGAYFIWSGLPEGATFADDMRSEVSFTSKTADLTISCRTKKVSVSAEATDSGTQFSIGSGAWTGSLDESIYAISNAIPDISVRNVYFEGAHFVWSGLPSGATVSGDYNSTVHFENPPENLEIECHAARLDFSATASDAYTQLSLDGENWASSIQLPSVFATTNLTVYARNTSGSSHAFFTWGNLPAGATMGDVSNSSVSFQIPLVDSSYAITCSSMASDDLNIWTGGAGNFEDDTKWSLGEAPGATSIAIIPNKASAYTVTVNTAFNIAELILGGGEGSGYPTLSLSNGVKTNNVAGAVTIARGATLTHRINDNGSNQYKLCLKCASMTIASGGIVTASGKGPNASSGKATVTTTPQTGKLVQYPCYGGIGGIEQGTSHLSNRICWGSVREPTDLGGAGTTTAGATPGGAIYLEVTGALVVDGSITSDGANAGSYYSGTGGSVYLKVGSISGVKTATITANGGAISSSAGGGGGRISIRQSASNSFSAYAGTIKAYGSRVVAAGNKMAGCGTIYLEHSGDVVNEGTLVVDNGPTGAPYNDYAAVLWNDKVVDRNLAFGTVIVTNNARLHLPSGATLKIKNRLCTKKGKLVSPAGSSVVFLGNGDAYIDGTNTFYSLTCTTPGKTLYFGTGDANKTTISSGGSLTLSGVNLRSKTDGTRWQFNVGENAVVAVDHCDVKDSNNTGMTVSNIDGIDSDTDEDVSTHNPGWSFPASARPGDLATWTGESGTSWSDASNWSPMRTPDEDSRILIPAGCERWPIITSSITVNSLTNELGASLTLSGANLTVTNAFSSLGTMAFGTYDVLEFVGDGDQVVELGNLSYSRITADKSGGSIEFLSGFKARHFLARARTPVAFTFAAGDTVEAEHLSLVGLVGESGAYDHALSIGSSGTWYLKTTGAQHVRGVTVSNCNATPGATIMAGALSTAVGEGNANWDFSPTAAAEWIGGGTTFADASYWADGIVPQAETQVCICPTQGTYTVSTAAATATGSIVVGGDGGAVSFTSNYKHDIAGGLYMLSGATCTFGYWSSPNEVTGDFFLGRGAVLTHTATTSGSAELYKLNFEVGGDATLEAGSTVNIQNKGFGGTANCPGRTSSGTGGSAFAGLGSESGNKPYGSILHPFSLGSRGYSGTGGGAFKLIVEGDVVMNGSIVASSTPGAYAPGTGGSVWISGASVKGSGSISVRAQSQDSWGMASSAGRIAVYQTERIGWSDYTPSVDMAGYSGGTYYREDGSGKGELYVSQANNASGQTWIPMGDDALADYAKVMVTVSGGNAIAVTNRTWRAGSTLKLRDMSLSAANAKVYLKSSKIKILSRDHKDGEGWPGGDYASRTNAATITLRDAVANTPGAILWPTGFSVSIR